MPVFERQRDSRQPGAEEGRGKNNMKEKRSKNPKIIRCNKLLPLPVLKKSQLSTRELLFEKKCRQCCVLFDFSNPTLDLKSKEVKTAALHELLDYIVGLSDDVKRVFFQSVCSNVIKMFSINAFRTLPPSGSLHEQSLPDETEETAFEPSWPHLNLVYSIFLLFLEHFDNQNDIFHSIGHSFTTQLLQLFDSEDPREREYCKRILHKIYSNFPQLRLHIRKQVSYIFFTFIYETERFNGAAELLEMWATVINGMAVPLRQEHKTFLLKVLLPLHKVKSLALYHPQLLHCVTRFLEKDSFLSVPFIKGLLQIWPQNQYYKEVLFLEVLEDALDYIDQSGFKTIMVPLFHRLAKLISSLHFHVVERVISYWNNEFIMSLVGENAHVIFPIVIPALYKNYKSHWNKSVDSLVFEAMKTLSDIDHKLYNRYARDYLERLKETDDLSELDLLTLNTANLTISNPSSVNDLSEESIENEYYSSTDENNPTEANMFFPLSKGRDSYKKIRGKSSSRKKCTVSIKSLTLSLHDTTFIE